MGICRDLVMEPSLGLGLILGQRDVRASLIFRLCRRGGNELQCEENFKSELYYFNSPGLQFHWTVVNVRFRGSIQEFIFQDHQDSR